MPSESRWPDEGSSLGNIATAAKEKAQDLASTVASKAGEAWDNAKQAASTVATTAEDAWGEMANVMRRYPIATFAQASV
jgi:hypothetical protein